MIKFLGLALLGFSSMAFAQTPAANMMPDGSKDLYVGLGVESLPRYEGSSDQRTQIVPAIQMQWSNGIFWSGLTTGMHLSEQPGIEYGPLFAVDPGRSHASVQILGLTAASGTTSLIIGSGAGTAGPPSGTTNLSSASVSVGRADVNDTGVRLEYGGFFNFYLDPSSRLATSLLYGAGENHKGMLFTVDAQKSMHPGEHHTLSFSAGFTWANEEYIETYYNVAPDTGELLMSSSIINNYAPQSGIKDIHLGVHWNWELNNAWLLTSQINTTRLTGSAADSPLTDKRNNVTLSAALAFRF
jgi:outer membrane scaffolding protein for murein synthesis (MipA/OmpV family)